MRKIPVLAPTLGLLALAGTTAFADEMPKGPIPTATPAPVRPAPGHGQGQGHGQAQGHGQGRSQSHMQGMDHGGQQMHDQMMQDHRQGMQNMPNASPHGSTATPSKKGCCKGKAMKPKDGAMPMNDM